MFHPFFAFNSLKKASNFSLVLNCIFLAPKFEFDLKVDGGALITSEDVAAAGTG